MLVLDLKNGLTKKGLDSNDEAYNNKKKHILDACSSLGFFYVKNHGIEEDEVNNMFNIAKTFFKQNKEYKVQYLRKQFVGYVEVGQEKLSEIHDLDYKEAFNLPSNYANCEDMLPPSFEENKQRMNEFNKKCNNTCQAILEELALCLDLKKDFFYEAHQFDQPSGSVMRILHYPPIPKDINKEKAIRAGSHSDYGTMTLLFQEDAKEGEENSGLQVLDNNEEWIDVPYKKGHIIVNIADLFSIWTEGKLRSAKHRVVLPSHDKQHTSRYSMAYFLHAKSDYKIYPISQLGKPTGNSVVSNIGPSPFTYGETDAIYLQRRLNATYK